MIKADIAFRAIVKFINFAHIPVNNQIIWEDLIVLPENIKTFKVARKYIENLILEKWPNCLYDYGKNNDKQPTGIVILNISLEKYDKYNRNIIDFSLPNLIDKLDKKPHV